MGSSTLEQAKAILAQGRDMTLATNREDGFPQATTVSYVADGTDIYFGCAAKSQKARNIERDNKVSATVDLDYESWDGIKGVSLGAVAERLSDPDEMQRVGELMFDKFPEAREMEMPEEEMALFRLRPVVISVLDYSKEFGHTEEVRP